VYVQVTDAEGTYDLVLELVRLDDMMVVGRASGQASITDRLMPSEFIFQLHLLEFKRPGKYEFRLSTNGRHLAAKSLTVVELGQGYAKQEE